jgi:hypothetical protein
MTDFLLRLPAPLRHLALLVLAVLLSWLGTDILPFLQNESNVFGALLSALLVAFLAWATPLVSSYGAGAQRAKQLGARTVSESYDAP